MSTKHIPSKIAKVKQNWWRKTPLRTTPRFEADTSGYLTSGTVVALGKRSGDYICIEVWVNADALETVK